MTQHVAFLYPGQGTLPQEVVPAPTDLETLYGIAADAGLPLRDWIVAGDTERLTRTDAAQPAIFLDSVVRTALLQAAGVVPNVAAGHSLGEYAALVAAEVLAAEDALRLVLRRGVLMNGIPGGMAAVVKLDLERVRSLCGEIGPSVCVANHNGPTQVVVSGSAAGLEALAKVVKSQGGQALPLQVSGPFHSPFMRPAEVALAPEILRTPFSVPRVPIVSSVSGAAESDTTRLKALLATQITSCVRWMDVLGTLAVMGTTHAVEVGAGSVLTNLGRRATDRIRFVTYKEAVDGAL
ncbi:MAG: ACP S-malonyltransferase [Candidatus Bipolaricaulota bacterium]|nr:ACP S-malonyltransferase [Candidatus Bipolaricaulota bacterium]